MAVTKLSNSGIKTGVLKYDSMLAGNAAYDPAATWLIATATGTGSSNTITFSSIPTGYTSLQIRGNVRPTGATNSTHYLRVQFNSDTGNNYSHHDLIGDGASATATGTASAAFVRVVAPPRGVSASDMHGTVIIDIHDYLSTTRNKTVRAIGGFDTNGGSSIIGLSSGFWNNTAAITSISLVLSVNNWATTTKFSLYGMKG